MLLRAHWGRSQGRALLTLRVLGGPLLGVPGGLGQWSRGRVYGCTAADTKPEAQPTELIGGETLAAQTGPGCRRYEHRGTRQARGGWMHISHNSQ